MSTRSRRLLSILSLALVVLLAACGSAEQSPGPSPSGGPTLASSPAASGAPSASAGAPSASAGAPSAPAESPAADTQTDTAWGRIWDGVPAGFPIFPGSTIAGDTSPEPVSATYSIANDDTAVIATWMQAALENASFRTEGFSGPLEDGSFVLESVGQGDCRVQVIVVPMGGLTFVTVRYGAACPAG
jgi:hypothetical protein